MIRFEKKTYWLPYGDAREETALEFEISNTRSNKNKETWLHPGKISEGFVSQKTTKTVFFLNILQKDHQLRILGTLKMSGHFH